MMKISNTLLLKVYVVSFSFSFIFDLPYLGAKIQLPELIFPFLFLASKPWKWSMGKDSWTELDGYIIIFILGWMLIGAFHPGKEAWLNTLGLVYLFAAFQVASRIIGASDDPAALSYSIVRLFSLTLLLSVAFSWSNYYFMQIPLGIELLEPKYLPGAGYLPRTEGFTASPNMLAGFLSFCLLCRFSLFLSGGVEGGEAPWLDFALLLALASTFSKSLLVFGAACCFLYYIYSRKNPAGRWAAGIGALVFLFSYLAGTNIMVIKKGEEHQNEMMQQTYFSGKLIRETESYRIFETTHLALKRNAWEAFRQNPFLGIGGGAFPSFLREQQENGGYPSGLPIYSPHSTYFGTLAEYGIIGFLLFLVFWIMAGYFSWRERLAWVGKEQALITGISVFFLMAAVEATAMDVLNFRHLWLGLGVVAGFSRFGKKGKIHIGHG